ncbi:peptide transporter 3 [Prunus dulcis]|uniref:Peptide transporter 3 n=1 Tax=Prunus dulcis TaxID=3755 RepID=A0A4Y1R8Y1_PRUDU|nr:peptide transporter 3 [Prunus dulcis]
MYGMKYLKDGKSWVSANLVVYLTRKLHEGTVQSSNNGMSLLTLAVSVPALKPPACNHGIQAEDCTKASPFQLELVEPSPTSQPWEQTNLMILSLRRRPTSSPSSIGGCLPFSLATFSQALSWCTYKIMLVGLLAMASQQLGLHKLPSGSPITSVAQILVAVRKWKVPVPNHPKELYELSLEYYADKSKLKIDHTTSSLRSLDRAAVKSGPNTHMDSMSSDPG